MYQLPFRGHGTRCGLPSPLPTANNGQFSVSSLAMTVLKLVLLDINACHGTDIETQVDHLNHHLRSTLQARCSARPSRPKKTCLSDETWALRQQRVALKRRLAETQSRLRREALTWILRLWRDPQFPNAVESETYQTTLHCGKLRLYVQLTITDRRLRGLLQKDKARALNDALAQLPKDAPASVTLQKVKPIIGSTNLKKFQRKPLPMIHDVAGQAFLSAQTLCDRWIDFFRHMECGERMDHQELRRRWHDNLRQFCQAKLRLCTTDVPSLYDLETAFRRVKANKATGDDGIPSELCHTCPVELARFTYTQL